MDQVEIAENQRNYRALYAHKLDLPRAKWYSDYLLILHILSNHC